MDASAFREWLEIDNSLRKAIMARDAARCAARVGPSADIPPREPEPFLRERQVAVFGGRLGYGADGDSGNRRRA